MDARFTIRLPENAVLERLAAPYPTRPPGRPPKEGYEFPVELAGYKNPKWSKEYRVVLVVVDKPGKDGSLALFPHHFFIVTNWTKERFPAWKLVIAPLWQALLNRVGKLQRIKTTKQPGTAAFTPLPSHAHTHFTPRM